MSNKSKQEKEKTARSNLHVLPWLFLIAYRLLHPYNANLCFPHPVTQEIQNGGTR
jgi:hypothetical protein